MYVCNILIVRCTNKAVVIQQICSPMAAKRIDDIIATIVGDLTMYYAGTFFLDHFLLVKSAQLYVTVAVCMNRSVCSYVLTYSFCRQI